MFPWQCEQPILTKHETNAVPSCIVHASPCLPRTRLFLTFYFYALSVPGERPSSRHSLPAFHSKIHSCQTSERKDKHFFTWRGNSLTQSLGKSSDHPLWFDCLDFQPGWECIVKTISCVICELLGARYESEGPKGKHVSQLLDLIKQITF